MTVPDDLILVFFRDTTARLLEVDPEAALSTATENNIVDNANPDLPDCRRCVLNEQMVVLNDVIERHRDPDISISPTQVQERLGRLQHEPDLSPELRTAMDDMNEAARIAVCKLMLYTEERLVTSSSSRNLQDEGRLERTKMMEYFGLCQASLKLQCVVKFLNMTTSGDLIFPNEESINNKAPSTTMMFPQSRLEYVQQLLAKGIGWDPVFVTSELRKIFVEKPEHVDYDYYDNEVMLLFQQLVEQMMSAVRDATLQIRSKQDTEMLNDLGKGGNTRVVSVQYSEYEVDQHGNKIDSKNNAPERSIDERQDQLTEEEKKRQLRLASEANVLQQTILAELLVMDPDERERTLEEAGRASRSFTEAVMALPMGKERIDFLRSVDPKTSRQLAIHKLWNGMLQANGGRPPTMVAQK